jgi:hypothetical protein
MLPAPSLPRNPSYTPLLLLEKKKEIGVSRWGGKRKEKKEKNRPATIRDPALCS